LELPIDQEWLGFRQKNEKYGDVIYTEALGEKTVFLGTTEAVNDLLEDRARYTQIGRI
jgi:hypothetical protein